MQLQYLRQVKMYLSLCAFMSFLVSFGICIYLKQFFDSKAEISTRVTKKKSKSSSKEYIKGKHFKF